MNLTGIALGYIEIYWGYLIQNNNGTLLNVTCLIM